MKYTKFLLTVSLVTLSLVNMAQPGTLDNTFGNGGKVLTDFANGDALCYTSILQRDGKILAAGTLAMRTPGTDDRFDGFFIIRYSANGNIDSSFGENGYLVTNFDSTLNRYGSETIYSVAIQPDGKIVAAGYGYDSIFPHDEEPAANFNVQLARYLPDGTLDSSFGNNGTTETDFGLIERAYAMILLPDGRIVVGGSAAPAPYQPQERIENFLLVRYLPDGRVDESFGNMGKVITDLNSNKHDVISSLALQEDGKIVAAGTSKGSIGTNKFALARYQADGGLDDAFGNNGTVITDFGPNDEEIHDMALQPDGKIVVAGIVHGLYPNPNMGVARYNTNGTLDESFGTEGKVDIKFSEGESRAFSIALQSNGKILAAGDVSKGDEFENFALARCLPDGSLDSAFGVEGKVVTDMESIYDYANTCLLQQDGKIVLVGSAYGSASGSKIALARYNGDATEQPAITKLKTWIHDIVLNWFAANNSSVNYYSIERSSTGSNFTEEKRVNAEKTASLIQNAQNHEEEAYNYVLSAAETNTYYRIKAVTKEGNIIYSDVLFYNGNITLVTVYPNPVKNVLTVNGLNASAKNILSITDFNGNVLLNTTVQQAANYNWNVSRLNAGRCVLTVKTGNQIQTVKFLKD